MRNFSWWELMPNAPKKSRLLQKVLLAVVIALIFLSIGLAALHQTPWQVPQTERLRKNPVPVSAANYNAAKPLYDEYCANCHGDAGKGDGSDAMMYDPAPSDLTDSSHINKLSDGEIFYQITQGRKPMPSFRNKLSEEQRWQLVIFVRALSGAVSFPAAPANAPDPPASKKADSPAKH
jgi:mono/diheme cytochrome c family protein